MNTRGPDLYFPEFFPKGGDGWVRGRDGDRYRRFYAAVYRGPFRVHALVASRTKELPTAPWNGIIGDPAAENTDGTGFVDATFDHPVRQDLGFLARVYVHSSIYKAAWPWSSDDCTRGCTNGRSTGRANDGFSVGAEGRLDWQPSPDHRILAGAELRGNRYLLRFRPHDALARSHGDDGGPAHAGPACSPCTCRTNSRYRAGSPRRLAVTMTTTRPSEAGSPHAWGWSSRPPRAPV